MLYTSPIFILIFLPLVLGVYAISPAKQRKYVILVSNILFYTLTNLKDLSSVVFLCLILFITLIAVLIVQKIKNSRTLSAFIVVFCVALVLLFYTTRIITQSGYGILDIAYPLGASIYILNAISLLVDIKRGDVKKPKSYVNFVIYLSFFPVMIAGPLIKYKNFEEYIDKPQFNLKNFSFGSKLFAIGFIKRIAIAAVLYEAYESISFAMDGNVDFIHAVVHLALFSLIVYFAFSGYSDMGCGMSNMLGITQNRDYANSFAATGPVEYMSYFFNSMLEWTKDYIINPFMSLGKGENTIKKLFSGFIVCCFLTLWYKINLLVLASLLPILIIITINNYFYREKQNKRMNFVFRLLARTGTWILMSIYWISIKVENPYLLFKYFVDSLTNFSTYTSYYTYLSFTNLKYIIIFAVAIIILACTTQLNVVKLSKINAKLPKYIKDISAVIIMLAFFISIYYFLPQYPEYATKAYWVFDI